MSARWTSSQYGGVIEKARKKTGSKVPKSKNPYPKPITIKLEWVEEMDGTKSYDLKILPPDSQMIDYYLSIGGIKI